MTEPPNPQPSAARKTRRLFIGVAVDPRGELKQSLGAALRKMRIGADRHAIELNWVPQANFHITLNFLGAIDPTRIAELVSLIRRVAETVPPLSTSLRGVGGFPDERHMRTLWIGVRLSRALGGLQETLRDELIRAGFPQEERPYRPHLTIAKTRKARSATDLVSPFVRAKFGELLVERVLLYESLQHGPHTSYEVLESVILSGSPGGAAEVTTEAD